MRALMGETQTPVRRKVSGENETGDMPPVQGGQTGSIPESPHSYRLIPANAKEVNELVSKWHRHNAPLGGGSFFSVGLADNGALVGGVIVGPISARLLNSPYACELKRLVTDGTPNACSMLYGAARRAAKSLGYEVMYTYTLQTEPGSSLRGSGWTVDDPHVPARQWKSRAPEYADLRWKDRPDACASPSYPRVRWKLKL